jgi:superfamily II DNA/RNA helicase
MRNYKQNRSNNISGRNFGPRRSGNFRSGHRRKISSLDPKLLIKKTKEASVEVASHIPAFEYKDLDINPNLKANLLAKRFTSPTPIQEKAIPEIMNGNDIVGIANTGTGKTGAFLIPTIDRLTKDKTSKILIIAPTRELADQIEHDTFIFTKNLGLRSTLVVGGMNINAQIGKLRSNPHIVVGTPGRILDLIERQALRLHDFKTVILDEVDRMLDMGFVDDVKKIISFLPKERQSLFFSATMNRKVEEILSIFSKNPITISVKTGNTSDNVHQDIIKVRDHSERHEKLIELLKSTEVTKAIIFLRTKRGVRELDDKLYNLGFKVSSLHGDKSQPQRKRSLDAFKRNITNTMIATDVAARGLDVSDISHVINFDMPETYDDYAHRIGRTGRGGKKGIALTFVIQGR